MEKFAKSGELAAESCTAAFGLLIEPDVFFETFGFFEWAKQRTKEQAEAFKRGYRRRYAELTSPQPETD